MFLRTYGFFAMMGLLLAGSGHGQVLVSGKGRVGAVVKPQVLPGNPQGLLGKPQGLPVKPQGLPGKSQGLPGKPQGLPVKPQGLPGKPQVVPGKPQVLPGKPQGLPVKPQVLPGKPQVLPGKPQGLPVKPQVLPGKPQVLPGKPQGLPGGQPPDLPSQPFGSASLPPFFPSHLPGMPNIHIDAVNPPEVARQPPILRSKPPGLAKGPSNKASEPSFELRRIPDLPGVHVVPRRPSGSANQPPDLAKQPPGLPNKPPVLANKPAVLANKPAVLANKPPVLANKPSVLANKPPALANKPPVLASKPLGILGMPTFLPGVIPRRPKARVPWFPNKPIGRKIIPILQPQASAKLPTDPKISARMLKSGKGTSNIKPFKNQRLLVEWAHRHMNHNKALEIEEIVYGVFHKDADDVDRINALKQRIAEKYSDRKWGVYVAEGNAPFRNIKNECVIFELTRPDIALAIVSNQIYSD